MDEPIGVLIKALTDRGATTLREIGDAKCFGISHYRIVMAELPLTATADTAAAEAGLERALEVWRSAPGEQVADIYLMYVAPWGTSGAPEWDAVAARIERDQRVCRKLVWLPDEGSGNLDRFLDRTFLARPWNGVESVGASALEALESDFALPEGWLPLLLGTLTETDLIESLVKALPEEKA